MGGYKDLIVYQQAVLIFDLGNLFCKRYYNPITEKRTIEQMQQANRSGKQNIVEGSLEKSTKLAINLTSVSRASYGELLGDVRDFIRIRGLTLWDKNDPRLLPIRQMKTSSSDTNWSNLANWSNWTNESERFANPLITLISKETYSLDKLIAAMEQKFIQEGGYTENLLKKRLNFRKFGH